MSGSWQIKPLGEFIEIRNGKNQQGVLSKNGKYPILGSGGNVMGYASDYICEAGTTIIGRKGNISTPLYVNEKFWNVDTAFGFYPLNESHIDKRFVYYLCLNIDFKSLNRGTTIPSLVKSELLKINIPVPPLSDQQRLVAILDNAFATIDKAKANTEKNLQNVREIFESYLGEIFETKGDGWVEMTLEEVVEENCTLSYGIVQPGEEFANGLPIVRPTDLTSRYIKVDGLKKIDSALADGYKRTRLVGNELLLCVRGSTGVISVATEELAGANVTRGIVPIRFNSNFVTQAFGYFLLISRGVQTQIKAKTYGAALMQINIGDLRKILVSFPSVTEQISIVRKLNSFLEKTKDFEIINRTKNRALEELKKSILKNAFASNLNL